MKAGWKWSALLAAALGVAGAGAAAEPPAAEPGEIARCEEAFRTGSGAGRVAAGLALVEAQVRGGQYDFAIATLHRLAGVPGIAPAELARSRRRMAEIAFFQLNEVRQAVWAANALLKIPELTDADRAFAEAMLARCQAKLAGRSVLPEERSDAEQVAARIRRDHPRLFFNRETWPLIVRHWKRPAIQAFYRKYVRSLAENAPDRPKLWNGETGQTKTPDRRYVKTERPSFYGHAAAACVLVYRLEGDPAFRDKAIRLLTVSAAAADESYRVGVLAGDDYYSGTMLHALAAYDWLYEELTPEQRREIGGALLRYAVRSETEGGRFVVGVDPPGVSGFYGIRMLKWYAGLVTLGDGIDDEAALKMLYEGHLDHRVMLAARDLVSGDDGGFVSTANNYVMSTYLWSTFNYLSSLRSAAGIDRAGEIRHLKYFPQWCAWNMIVGSDRTRDGRTHYLFDFGVGDTGNTDKVLPNPDLLLFEALHFLPGDAKLRSMAMALIQDNPLELRWPNSLYRMLTPLLLWDMPEVPERFDRVRPKLGSHARFFENLGIVFMRSGSTPQDTYASFVTNKKIAQHRHFDANSFMIYRHDFLALDTGTRIGFKRNDYEQLPTYYAQTVAHNAVLIHMPKEKMPPYWGSPREAGRYACHGGQDRSAGDRCAAYETNDRFTYVAGDATPVYSAKKCKLALRQFVFVYPDLFVIADRVTSTRPEYRKEWLLHSQNEPAMLDDRTFRFDDGGGRLFCRTLLPGAVKRRVVGGPGHEFEASGRNWELPEAARPYAEKKNYLGRYRVEIAPETDRAEDYFLHVIQVGRDDVPAMIATRLVEDERSFGTEFETAGGKWRIAFAKKGPAAGTVKLEKDGKVLLDRPLRADVQPQSGLD